MSRNFREEWEREGSGYYPAIAYERDVPGHGEISIESFVEDLLDEIDRLGEENEKLREKASKAPLFGTRDSDEDFA